MEFFLGCTSVQFDIPRVSAVKRVRYRVENEKKNSISPSNHVLFCLLHKQLTNKNKSIIQPRT